MPALDPEVSAYIDRVITTLNTGPDLSAGLRGAGQNYALALDTANVLELLTEAMAPVGNLAATGGTATTVEIASGASDNAFAGATITFDAATTTVALQGVSATVLSTAGNVFTLAAALPAVPAAGELFTLSGGVMSASIATLRNGRSGKGSSPLSNVFGYNRTAYDAMQKLHEVEGTSITDINLTHSDAVTAAGSTVDCVVTATDYRIDAYKGLLFTVGGEERTIVSHSENAFKLNKALNAAPAADVDYLISRRLYQVNQGLKHTIHPGGHPDNLTLAGTLNATRDLVVAFVVPS